MIYRFWDSVIKDCSSCFGSTLCYHWLWRKPIHAWAALWRRPQTKGLTSANCLVTEFGSRSQFPSRLSPSRELDCNLMRYPDPEPSKSVAPEFQNVRNCVRKQVYCFLLLNFIVICYTAINNSYTYFHKVIHFKLLSVSCDWSGIVKQKRESLNCLLPLTDQ